MVGHLLTYGLLCLDVQLPIYTTPPHLVFLDNVHSKVYQVITVRTGPLSSCVRSTRGP